MQSIGVVHAVYRRPCMQSIGGGECSPMNAAHAVYTRQGMQSKRQPMQSIEGSARSLKKAEDAVN